MKTTFLTIKILFAMLGLGFYMLGAWVIADSAKVLWVSWATYSVAILFAFLFLHICWSDQE